MHQIVRVEFPLCKQLYKWILSKGNRRSRNDWNYRERNSQWPISCPLKLDNQWPGDFAHRNTYFWSIDSQGKLISISFFFFFNIKSHLPATWRDMWEMATHSSILIWENPVDRGDWQATVHGVTKSWTWLNDQNNSDNPCEAGGMLESMSSKVYNTTMIGLLNQ